MSEQLANLYSTTLAASYVAGSGAITVASTTGAPISGTFSLTILDASTGDVILIFRVTSVSGSVFTGASEGPDTNAASGSVVVGTILTAAAITQIKSDVGGGGGGGFIQPLTAPVESDFTPQNFNVGTGVTTTQINSTSPVTSITLIQSDPDATYNIAALDKAKINSLFTVTIAITLAGWPNMIAGLWLSDGGSPPNSKIYGIRTANGLMSAVFSAWVPGFVGFNFGQYDECSYGPLLWLRVQETSSNRIFSLSSDGVHFIQIFVESNTGNFTTSRYGIALTGWNNSAAANQGPMMTLYSFEETTP